MDRCIPIPLEISMLLLVIHLYLITLLEKITVHLVIVHCIAIALAHRIPPLALNLFSLIPRVALTLQQALMLCIETLKENTTLLMVLHLCFQIQLAKEILQLVMDPCISIPLEVSILLLAT